MRLLPCLLALCAGLLGASSTLAVEVKTAFGSLEAPEGISLVNR